MEVLITLYRPLCSLTVLKILQIDRIDRWRGHYCPGLQELQNIFYCPNLQHLLFGVGLPSGADLTPIMQLQQLTALLLATDAHVKTASCLASLAGLKQLTLRTFNLPDESLLCLAALTGLSVLSIAAVDDVGGFHGLSKELLPLLPGPSPPPGAQRTRLQFQDGWVSLPL